MTSNWPILHADAASPSLTTTAAAMLQAEAEAVVDFMTTPWLMLIILFLL